jgi:outer membrane biosynthesis protein TonB
MKSIRLIGTSALFLILGLGAPAFARQDKPDDHGGAAAAKPAQQDARPAQQEQAKPAPEESKPAEQQQAKPAPQPQAKPAVRTQTAAKPAARPQTAAKPAARTQTAAKPAARPQQARSTSTAKPATRAAQQPQQAKQQTQSGQQGHVQRTAAQQQTQRSQPAVRESGRTSTRIPDAQYSSNFGSGHRFRMGNPQMVGGYSRFQYGGFWFGFVQPWPADWYYTDDVYIVYVDGGYYMYDPYYPGSRIEISVVM